MNTSRVNHEMIVLAREIRGITQSKLSKIATSISQGNLSRMEKGKLSVSDSALNELTEILNFPKEFFFQKKVKTPINQFYYRKRVTIPKRKLFKLEAFMDLMRMSLDNLFIDIELPTLNIPHIDTSSGVSPEEAARKLREYLDLQRGPVRNLVNLLEINGVVVFLIDSESDKFDGITLFTDARHPIIFLNSNLPNDRKRFTLAHELGHLVLHIRQRKNIFTKKQFDEQPDDFKETEANRFASEFLMPELDIRNDLAGLTMILLGQLKNHWQVSMKSLVYRANFLKVISARRAKNLYIELSRLGYVKNEPGIVDFDEPKIIKKTIKLLQDELDYTYEDIANDLHISLSDFMDFFLGKRDKIIQLKLKRKNTNNIEDNLTFENH